MPGLGLDDEVSYVNSYEKIFEGLKNGEYEFAICPIQVGNAFLEKFDLDDFQPSYAVTHVYGTLAMHPEDTMLRVRINAVLIQMQQEGRLAALDRKWIVSHYENMTITEMIKSRPWLAASILVSFFIVLILVLSIIFQHRQAIEREAAQQELAENFITITEQSEQLKHQQVDLIAAIDRAEQSSKAKTTFLFNMSHDIRTPMNAIIGYVELANKLSDTCKTCTRPRCPDEIPTKLRDFLQKIGASSQHLLALINDVLEMSRIESGKMELEPVDTDLVRMLTEVKDMFSSQMTTKHIEFIIDTSGISDRMVICDNHRFNRVLLNLLSNAYKFTPEGGRIEVTMKQLGDSWEFSNSRFANYELRVKDNGIGMTPEFAAKVFEAFERERTSTVSKIQGTGLGMAITKNIIDLMGGKIHVETAPNEGTEFIINVQLELSNAKPDLEGEIADENSAASEVDFNHKRLLLVDDIEINREIAKMMLEMAGFEVDTAENGKEAVDKVAASKVGDYQVVLMDIQMPVMDGYEAARAIRKLSDKKLAAIPIIAMTANAFAEDVKAALDAGMNAHLAKPIDVNKMMETLAETLKGN